ncbi:MAG: hypothetical protein WCJ37_00905 [Syntrophus sp. (in: bacteria)]
MKEEKTIEEKVDQEVMDSEGKPEPLAPVMITHTVFQKMKTKVKEVKAKELHCKGCKKREDTARKVAMMGGKAVVGLGTGVVLGVGVLSVAAVAEVALPVILTFKALGVTCGALGLVKGAKEFNK